jgi:hypothetical protein
MWDPHVIPSLSFFSSSLSLPFLFFSLRSSPGGRIWSDGGGEGRSGSGDGGTASNFSCTAASSSAGAAAQPGFMYGRILIALARQIRERYTRPGAIAKQAVSSVLTMYSFMAEWTTMAQFLAEPCLDGRRQAGKHMDARRHGSPRREIPHVYIYKDIETYILAASTQINRSQE